ncbi:hypothetical protein [Haliangium sp.]|uniref:hypothetical protein n=1 Tax=Haliangium sp. TaxID=2663208 RepID=UPI003D0C1908
MLFILLFASLVQAREAVERDVHARAATPDPGRDGGVEDAGLLVLDAGPTPTDAAAPDDAGLDPAARAHQRRVHAAERLVAGGVRGREVFAVKVSGIGDVIAIEHWRDGVSVRREDLDWPLIREVPAEESDQELAYRGEVQPAHRICSIVLAQADPPRPDLGGAVVVIAVDTPLHEVARALRDGLVRDTGGCFEDAAGLAILLDPDGDPAGWLGADLVAPSPGRTPANADRAPAEPDGARADPGVRSPVDDVLEELRP